MGGSERTEETYTVTCACCGRETMEVSEIYSRVPRFGRMVIVSMLCPKCGYRVSDSVSLEGKGPGRIEFRVKTPGDLSARLIRSQTSQITIPELGLELKPGPRSEAFITNIEGLLERFLQVAEQLEGSQGRKVGGKKKPMSRVIKKAMDGSVPFTIIVEDEMGNSAIIPADQFEP